MPQAERVGRDARARRRTRRSRRARSRCGTTTAISRKNPTTCRPSTTAASSPARRHSAGRQRRPDPPPARRRCGAHDRGHYACCDPVATATRGAAAAGPLRSSRHEHRGAARPAGRAERPDGARPARRLGPAHDDAAGGRRRAAASSWPRSSGSRTSAPPPTRSGLARGARGGRRARARSTATIVRLARRDWDRARRVPGELAAEIARAVRRGPDRVADRARGGRLRDASRPALRRNVELAREYAACFDDAARPVRRAARRLRLRADRRARADGLRAARRGAAAARGRRRRRRAAGRPVAPPADAQRIAVAAVLARLGVDDGAGASTSPRTRSASASGTRDSRVTTRYEDGELLSVIAAHARVRPRAVRAPDPAPSWRAPTSAQGTSMSMHESQSKLWENHVGRHPAFAPVIAERADRGRRRRSSRRRCTRRWSAVRPTLIRVSADPVTLPAAHRPALRARAGADRGRRSTSPTCPPRGTTACAGCSGVEVPDDADGVLQDVHWAAGAFGYFPSYALGCLIAAQLWEALEARPRPAGRGARRAPT